MVGTRDRNLRFERPLYTDGEAATYLRVPRTTMRAWTRGYPRKLSGQDPKRGKPVITATRAGRREPEIPFIA